jgi:regulator of RNase E activity RraA
MSEGLVSLAPETLDCLSQISTPTLCAQLYKLGFKNTFLHGVRPLHASARMVGEAVTLRFVPAREDKVTSNFTANPDYPQRSAIENIQPGQVLVADCRRETKAAAAGDILMTRLLVRGAAGFVTDGALRDYPAIAQMSFPVYAAGLSAPFHWQQHWAVDVNLPIGCAEVLVLPGDIMVGDGEGVVCIPRHVADQVASGGLAQEELERFLLQKVAAGAPLPGTYPPGEATLEEYEAYRQQR